MTRLSLFFLGPPQIERDGVPMTVDTRKATALLAYLAITRQRHSRDKLAGLLWPEYDQSHARATLRRTLSALHKALGEDALDLDRETISLQSHTRLWLDVEAFSASLALCRTHDHPANSVCPDCLAPLTEAVKLYRDDFLAGFSLRDSPEFDDWQFFQAEHLRRNLASALERLVACQSALGQFEPAIDYARRWLALDRLHEPAFRTLMQLYAWAGQRAAALHQYRECVQVMEQELGVAPLEETTRLYQAIKENQPPPRPAVWEIAPSRSSAPASVRSEPETAQAPLSTAMPAPVHSVASSPLVGRADEWTVLHRAYAASRASGQMIIIEGEAGIGKTRLAEEFLASLQRNESIVLATRCYEGETHLAYGPIVAAIRAAIAQKRQTRWLESIPILWVSEAARLLPELAALRPDLPPAPALDSPGAQSRFFEGLRQIILALCQGAQPGIFYVDDLHWADEATLDLLTYLARRLHEHPLCLIFTWRSEQMAVRPRLRQVLQETQRSGHASHLLPGRFSQDMVRELVQSVAAEQLGLAERLYQETEGIPLFLIHYLTALTSGVLKAEALSWSLPGGVRDLLHSRLAPVSETGWQLLTTAAVIGRAFDFDTLRDASGRSEEEAITALEELLGQSLIYELRGDSSNQAINYDFTHEKLRELVYEETSLARRRLLHRRVAEALTSRARGSRESPLAGLIASHYRLAGNDASAAHYYQLAGERARALYANAEALNHFQTALALGHPDPAALHEAIGDLHTLQGEYSAALRSYETAAALAMPEALAQLEHKLATIYERRGEWELAESHFEAALAAMGEQGPAAAQSRLYADWSRAAHRRGQTQQALDLAGRALALAETAQDTRALAQAHNILGILASSQHDLETARQHLEQSLALAEELNDLGARAAALNNLAFVSEARGDTEHALEQAEAALALCVAQGDRHREAALHNNLADLLHHAGRTDAAMPHLTQAVRIYAEIEVEAGTLQPEIWKLSEW